MHVIFKMVKNIITFDLFAYKPKHPHPHKK